MKCGKMHNSGDVVLAKIQYTDTNELKIRPCVVLFEDCSNIVVAGITSNTKMKGIPLTVKDGAIKDSVIKTNYIFTISDIMIEKFLFKLSKEKKLELYNDLLQQLVNLTN